MVGSLEIEILLRSLGLVLGLGSEQTLVLQSTLHSSQLLAETIDLLVQFLKTVHNKVGTKIN